MEALEVLGTIVFGGLSILIIGTIVYVAIGIVGTAGILAYEDFTQRRRSKKK